MIKWIYKRIIRKIDLSEDQLRELKERLLLESICKGSWVEGEKNCPNTTALAIKEGIGKFKVNNGVKRLLLKKYGVSNVDLWVFYAIFDIPAMMSRRFFEKSLVSMKAAIDELIFQK